MYVVVVSIFDRENDVITMSSSEINICHIEETVQK